MLQQKRILPAKILSLDFVILYMVTMRPYLLFVSGITGIVGLSFAPTLSIFTWTILSLVFFLSYGFGQALTDCFQTDTDALSSPYRPLVQGRVRRRDVLVVSLAGLFLSGIILTMFSLINLALSVIAVIGLATYTYFKRRWWAGPFYNAWIVALLCLIAFTAGSGAADATLTWSPGLLFTLVAVFFGYANFVLTGYYKDVSADRATGYQTLPVVFELRISSVVSDVFALLTLIASGIAIYLTPSAEDAFAVNWHCLLFAAAGIGAAILAQIRLHKVRSEQEAHSAIALVVHAYVLLLSAIATAQKSDWIFIVAVFYIGFVVTMRLRPMEQQI